MIDNQGKQHTRKFIRVRPQSQENGQVEKYKENKTYNYTVVSLFNVRREGFDDSEIKRKYYPIYNVEVDGAKIVTVYKKK